MKILLSKIVKIAKNIWVWIGAFLLVLLGLEFGSGLVLFISAHLHAPDPRQAYYKFLPNQMGGQILEDAKRITGNAMWKPYVYWSCKPFHGHYFNIDATGLRRTVHFNSPGKSIKIFIFGGSSLWGNDVPDEETIPSQLSKFLHEKGINAVVTNFAQIGYVNTQSLLTLLLELRKGNVPSIVIFYDGSNEILAALENGQSGVPQNEENRVKEFNITKQNGRMFLYIFRNLLSRAISLMTKVKSKLSPAPPMARNQPSEVLENDCLRDYVWNIQTVELLGNRYGFQSLFFWSPTVFKKPALTAYEKETTDVVVKDNLPKEAIIALYDKVHQSPVLAKDLRFHDLNSIFQEEKRTVFYDPVHLTALGDKKVARGMLPYVLEAVKKAYK